MSGSNGESFNRPKPFCSWSFECFIWNFYFSFIFFFKKFFHLVWKSKRKMKVKQNLSFNLKWLFYLLISEKYQRNTIWRVSPGGIMVLLFGFPTPLYTPPPPPPPPVFQVLISGNFFLSNFLKNIFKHVLWRIIQGDSPTSPFFVSNSSINFW